MAIFNYFDKSIMKKLVLNLIIVLTFIACNNSDFENEEIILPASNQIFYSSINGNVTTPYKASSFGDAMIISNVYENGQGIITFDKNLTTIESYAFSNCNTLTKILLPNSVNKIENGAFGGCSALISINIPKNVKKIGNNAFSSCVCLTSINIPEGVIEIGQGAFSGCKSLSNILLPNSLNKIGDDAFFDCRTLSNITIPENVKEIGYGVFYNCSNLSTFNGKLASNDGRCLIIDGEIKSFAQANITQYTIPEGISKIGKKVFANCNKITNIIIPTGVTNIGSWSFFQCTSLNSITIPEGVEQIEERAFSECKSLSYLTIPSSITNIGDCTFCSCNSLKNIFFKPIYPPTIGYEVFYGQHKNNTFGPLSCKIYVPLNSVNDYKTAEGWKIYADFNCIEGYAYTEQ